MEASCTKVYVVHGKDINSSNSYYKQRLDLTAASRKLSKMTGCLEIIEGEDDGQSKICQDGASYGRPSSNAGDRPWSRGSIGCFPPRTDSSMSRRMNTPTKQISLQAVRRKEESTEPFVDQVDWQPLTLENNRQIWKPETNTGYPEPTKQLVQADGFRLETVAETSWQLTEQLVSEPHKGTSKVTSQPETICEDGIVEAAQERGVNSGEKNREEKNTDDSDEDEGDDDDDDSDSSEEEEEKLRAPNELLMEFVDCLMRKDFQTASKLCKMILLYEPENPEALKFQPLIEEKLVLDAEAEKEAAEESSDDDSDDESEDEDDGNDASEDEDEDSSSEADSSEEDDDGSDDDDGDGGINGTGSNSNNNNNNNGIQESCWQRHLN